MAIEDTASLCALLPRGTTASYIPERLALYERVRDERAHKVQTLTRLAGMDLNDANRGNITSKPALLLVQHQQRDTIAQTNISYGVYEVPF